MESENNDRTVKMKLLSCCMCKHFIDNARLLFIDYKFACKKHMALLDGRYDRPCIDFEREDKAE